MIAIEIIKEYLQNNSYDGLCNDDCGCGLLDGLAPCNCLFVACEPAYYRNCATCSQYRQCFDCAPEYAHTYGTERCWTKEEDK